MTYTLDVLIPHYRNPGGLKASLDSVAQQTWRGNLRVVVVDDGSPDKDYVQVGRHCEEFQSASGFEFLLRRNETNLGRPRTRNRLLGLAEASHIAWLDAEDIWYPDKIQIQFDRLAELAHSSVEIDAVWITCNYDWAQNGTVSAVTQHVAGDQFEEILLGARLRCYLWTLLGTARSFRIAGRFDERLPRLQDVDYFATFSRSGGRIEMPRYSEPLCRYYKSDVGRAASDVRNSYKLILAKNAPALRNYPAGLSSHLHYKANALGARFARSNGQTATAVAYMAQAVLGSPRHAYYALRSKVIRRIRGGK